LSPDFSWKDSEWLLGEWNRGNVALKGVIRPDDAVKAVQEYGFDTVWVSNHGGRQLNTAPATIDVLPSIRNAVGNDVRIIIDGGIQRGEDIIKAMALGADGVGIGKPYLWGLCAGGYDGVNKVYDILQREMEETMKQIGLKSTDELKQRGSNLLLARTKMI
jgi:isopentenyl diphosphate isomerase/L-lactate dehydrogenase-like FMN-dependent dehydrogenase